jgi:Lipocalin-like domain
MNRRNAIRSAIALTLTFGWACGSDAVTAPVEVTSVAGTWNLTSVDAKPLPYLVSASDPKLEVIEKHYVITTAGTFTTSFTLRATELDGSVSTGSTSDSGTLTLANNTVTFTNASDNSVVVATVTPTTMTINAGAAQVFTKQ